MKQIQYIQLVIEEGDDPKRTLIEAEAGRRNFRSGNMVSTG